MLRSERVRRAGGRLLQRRRQRRGRGEPRGRVVACRFELEWRQSGQCGQPRQRRQRGHRSQHGAAAARAQAAAALAAPELTAPALAPAGRGGASSGGASSGGGTSSSGGTGGSRAGAGGSGASGGRAGAPGGSAGSGGTNHEPTCGELLEHASYAARSGARLQPGCELAAVHGHGDEPVRLRGARARRPTRPRPRRT